LLGRCYAQHGAAMPAPPFVVRKTKPQASVDREAAQAIAVQ